MNSKASFTVILLIFVIAVNVVFLTNEFDFKRRNIGTDLVTLYERRFEGMRGFLPKRGVVGYMTDQRPEDIFSDDYEIQKFYLTRYALSPVIVANDIGREFVVGNFHKGIPQEKDLSNSGLVIVRDFGDGAILFKRKAE